MPFQALPDTITIDSLRPRIVQADGSVAFEGDVVVQYGATRLLADRLVIYEPQHRAVVEGHVTMIDPDGTLQADRLEFGWTSAPPAGNTAPYDPGRKFFRAENAVVRVQGAFLRARRADLEPGEWRLQDVTATNSLQNPPVYLVTSDLVTVKPGGIAYIHQPRLSVLGKFLGEAPSQRVNLSPGVPSLHFPGITYRPHRGLGARWSGALLAGRDSIFSFNTRAAPQVTPRFFAQYTKSFLPITQATEIVPPPTETAERFVRGFMNSVRVDAPETETKFYRAARSSLSADVQVNRPPSDRARDTRLTEIEGVFERGGAVGDTGYIGQIRLQGIGQDNQNYGPRVTATGALSLPSRSLGGGLSTLARLDGSTYVGETLFSWARAEAGLTYSPKPWLRLSGAGYSSFQAGQAQYDFDPLYSTNGLLGRADFRWAGLELSYLLKTDVQHGIYDREFAIRQAVGPFEVSYVRRGYPHRTELGVTLRLQPLRDLVRRRKLGAALPDGTAKTP